MRVQASLLYVLRFCLKANLIVILFAQNCFLKVNIFSTYKNVAIPGNKVVL